MDEGREKIPLVIARSHGGKAPTAYWGALGDPQAVEELCSIRARRPGSRGPALKQSAVQEAQLEDTRPNGNAAALLPGALSTVDAVAQPFHLRMDGRLR